MNTYRVYALYTQRMYADVVASDIDYANDQAADLKISDFTPEPTYDDDDWDMDEIEYLGHVSEHAYD